LEENKSRVLVIADSTSMWMRPYRNHIDELTYTELLRKRGFFVDVVSIPGMTSREVLDIYWNQLGAKFYDIYIVSVGINDLTPRSYPRWMWKINNNLLVNQSIFSKLYSNFYRIFTNNYIQKIFSRYKISKPWIGLKLFEVYLEKFQKIVLKESDSKIIYLSLPLVSERVSSILYGINDNVLAYKSVFNRLVDNNRTFQLDIDTLFRENREKYNSEGIHYSADGHKKVFQQINKLIEEIK